MHVKPKSSWLMQFLNIVTALALFLMAVFVLGNVVLRYAFNSGITWSEEAARFLFIWMTFLGAIVAFRHNEHLGVDLLIKRLPARLKKIVYVISNLLVAYILWLIFEGGLKLVNLNADNAAPATGIPMSYIFGSGIVMSVGMFTILLYNLYRIFTDDKALDDLTRMKESEEEVLESLHHKQDKQDPKVKG